MRGGLKDSGDRQDKRISSLRNNSAGFLLSRLLNLINEIDVSLGLIWLNYSPSSYTGVTLAMDEALNVNQKISEFVGLLCYMQSRHKELLLPHRIKINRLKIKLGIYFV